MFSVFLHVNKTLGVWIWLVMTNARERLGEERLASLYMYIITIYAYALMDSSSNSGQAVRSSVVLKI